MKRSILFISGLLATGIVLAQAATPAQDAHGERMRNRMQERLDAKFQASDSNHDGSITQSEWQSARLREANEHFQKMDSNRDGKLTRTEVDAARDERMQGREHKRGERGERLRALDKDGDQQLSRAEIGKEVPRLAADFDRLDANRDGKLSREEIRAGRAPRDGR